MSLVIVRGDLMEADADTLVLEVDCAGGIGESGPRPDGQYGDNRYEVMREEHARRCAVGEVQLGDPYMVRWWGTSTILFPTRTHQRAPVQVEALEAGLRRLAERVEAWGVRSLAVPPLGCGADGLPWRHAGPILCRYLRRLPIPVELRVGVDQPAAQLVAVANRCDDGIPKSASGAWPLRILTYANASWGNVTQTHERLADLPAGSTLITGCGTSPLLAEIAHDLGLTVEPKPLDLAELARGSNPGFYAALWRLSADFLMIFGGYRDSAVRMRIMRRAREFGVPRELVAPPGVGRRLVTRDGPRPAWVYRLLDPRDLQPRYVGQTIDLCQRFDQHRSRWPLRGRRLQAWSDELAAAGLAPLPQVLEDTTALRAFYLEGCWIMAGQAAGWPLLNDTVRRRHYVSPGALALTHQPLVMALPGGGAWIGRPGGAAC